MFINWIVRLFLRVYIHISASSKSTKLIHGGIRYLAEAFEFSFKSFSERKEKLKLVKEAL